MPHALKNASAVVVIWPKIDEPDQFVLDLRSAHMKLMIKTDQPTKTLKVRTDVYEVAPQLVHST